MIPTTLTRFYSELEFVLDVIENKKLAFVHASKLNDPFDPNISLDNDFNSSFDVLCNYIKDKHTSDYDNFRNIMTNKKWQSFLKIIEDTKANTLRTFFNASFSDIDLLNTTTNIHYMFGHYANGHRGFAIEFVTEKLINNEEQLMPIVYKKPILLTCEDFYNIIINNNFNFINNTFFDETLRNNLHCKHTDWSYEKEYRLAVTSNDSAMLIQKQDIKSEAIKTIFTGVSTSKENIEKLVFSTKNNAPHIKIYKSLKEASFNIKFEQIL